MPSSIDILLPGARSLVAEWYDLTPAAVDGMPPHMTLLWPWVQPVTGRALQHLQEVLAGVSAFEVELGSTGRFAGVLYLEPSRAAPLVALCRRLWAAFPESPPYAGEVAHEIRHRVCRQAWRDLVVSRIVVRARHSALSLASFPVGGWLVGVSALAAVARSQSTHSALRPRPRTGCVRGSGTKDGSDR